MSCFFEGQLSTPLGSLTAIADAHRLYLLEFTDSAFLLRKKRAIIQATPRPPSLGRGLILDLLEEQLNAYFQGSLKAFDIPLFIQGTPFQQRVWESLLTIPYGHTCSYSALASSINQACAHRAVALACQANRIMLIIPCHRVVRKKANYNRLSWEGYCGGVERKEWLLQHEGSLI